jgi:F0F1-type ATP synthase alpha subunit
MIFSGVRGYLKSIPMSKISEFEEGLLHFVNSRKLFSPFVAFLKDELEVSEGVFDKALTHFIDSEFKS